MLDVLRYVDPECIPKYIQANYDTCNLYKGLASLDYGNGWVCNRRNLRINIWAMSHISNSKIDNYKQLLRYCDTKYDERLIEIKPEYIIVRL